MAFQKSHSVPFEKKTLENYEAGVVLFKQKMYNAAVTRFYYAFILLACRSIAIFVDEIDEKWYINDFAPDRIDKGKIKNNSSRLKINGSGNFRLGIYDAEKARIKADYYSEDVRIDEIETITPRLEQAMRDQGITI